MQKAYDVDVLWTAFPLHPETPEEGRTLKDLFQGRSMDIPMMMQRLKQVASEEGLPFADRDMTYNSRRAQELSKWAESLGRGDAFHREVFRAYFAEGRNIALVPVLVELAEAAGLPGEDAGRVLRDRTFRESVDADWTRSRDMGVTAVPTFVMGTQRVVGAQPYETLERFVGSLNAGRRT